jgi:hypothetical protein
MADPQKYPAKRYHATEAPRYVQDEAEDKALGKGWFGSPKKAAEAAPKKAAEAAKE